MSAVVFMWVVQPLNTDRIVFAANNSATYGWESLVAMTIRRDDAALGRN